MLTKTTWDADRSATGPKRGLSVRRLLPQSPFNVFAALDKPTGHRFLLLKSNQPDVRPAQPLPSGRGFNIQFVTTPSDPEGTNCLRFELTEPAHTDIFDVIGNDVLSNILQTTNDRAAFDAFVTRIVAWQRFLDELPAGGLTEQSQQGLFAELWFLREVMLPEIGPAKSVRAGPVPSSWRRTFSWRRCVRGQGKLREAARSHSPSAANCNSTPRALNDSFCTACFWNDWWREARRCPSSCSWYARTCRSILRLRRCFLNCCCRWDTPTRMLARYTSRFTVRSQHFFDVIGDFPRIVGSDLRAGVGDVHYSIMQSECEHYSLTEADARKLIKATLP